MVDEAIEKPLSPSLGMTNGYLPSKTIENPFYFAQNLTIVVVFLQTIDS